MGFDPAIHQKLMNTYFQKIGFKTIIDIGANTGQSVLTFRSAFPQATIHAIEPLPDCFLQLTRNTSSFSKVLLYNTAVGNYTGIINIFENDYSPSSSVLPIGHTHLLNFPHAQNRSSFEVPIDTLSNLLISKDLAEPMLIKMDVQGYEKHVIEGGTNVLSRAKLLIVEVSLEELYEGQPLFDDICAILSTIGFRYGGVFDQLVSPKTGMVLQQDAIFVRQ